MSFDQVFVPTIQHEQGYANNPKDKGGGNLPGHRPQRYPTDRPLSLSAADVFWWPQPCRTFGTSARGATICIIMRLGGELVSMVFVRLRKPAPAWLILR